MTEALDALGIPTCGLKACLTDMNVLCSGVTGAACPRCGGTDFWKLGSRKYKEVKRPCRVCRDCGYTFTIQPIDAPITQNRAARILNLDKLKGNRIFEDALTFGLITRIGEDKHCTSSLGKRAISGNATRMEIYNNIPIYRHLIEAVGFDLKRSKFEAAIKYNPDGSVLKISKTKRDTLWRRYREIAVEIFVCEKTCQFSRTCKKDHRARKECDIVKKALKPKRIWKAEIEI